MFSVPGWNVSAPLKTQIDTPKPKEQAGEGKKGKKRKRKQDEQVNEDNVGEYLEKVVAEGNRESKDEQAGQVEAGEGTADGAAEKRGKKRKRKSSKGKKEVAEGHVQADDAAVAEQMNASADAPKPIEKEKDATDAQSKHDKKKRKKNQKPDPEPQPTPADGPQKPLQPTSTSKVPQAVSLIPEPAGLTPLQKSMRTKLASARFRHLNESLYTKPSKESLHLFKENPTMFEDYHRGFAQQVEVWPENPVDGYVASILARGKIRTKDPWKDKKRQEKKKGKHGTSTVDTDTLPSSALPETGVKPLPRNMRGHSTIADLGCGTASLSYNLQSHVKSLDLTLHSFDLSRPTGASAALVTVADISALPLPDSSVDVAIFCLALMGTNWLDFIDEAWRVLRWRGELWISEIKSRFGRVSSKSKPGKPPINSIGSLRKPDRKDGAKAKKKDSGAVEEGPQDSGDEAELAERVDGAESREGTDVSAFVDVLRKRGFVLDALPERPMDAVDLSNKMFVRLQFVKSVPPTRGKNAKKEEAGSQRADARDMRGMRMGLKGKKFAAVADDGDDAGADEKDGKVLKPCLYKIR